MPSKIKFKYKDKKYSLTILPSGQVAPEEEILGYLSKNETLSFERDFPKMMKKVIKKHNLKFHHHHPAVGRVYKYSA